jgi:hypothetical protein
MAADLESGDEKPVLSKDHSNESKPDEAAQPAAQEEPKSSTVVDWDGPTDPQNPRNWPAWKRMTQVVLASLFLLTA